MAFEFINRTISVLYRYGQRFFTQKLKSRSLPIEVGQLPFIMQAYRYPGITQEGMSANTVMDKGTTARSVKQLEKLGLVVREIDLQDKRINHIYPTQKALEIKGEVFETINELHRVLYKGFSDSEIADAISFLSRMKSNIADHFEQGRD